MTKTTKTTKAMTVLGLVLAMSGAAIGQDWIETQRLEASTPVERAHLGSQIDFHGGVLIAGAPGHPGGSELEGAAYIFARDGSQWVQQAELLADPPMAFDQFGFAVAVWEGVAVVGVFSGDGIQPDSGTAIVYEQTGSQWRRVAQLSAADGATADWFGYSADMANGIIAVGAPQASNGGAVYIFEYDGAQWRETAKLQASDSTAGARFGSAVAIEEDRVLVGATDSFHEGIQTGAAYMFERDGGPWSQVAKLVGVGLDDRANMGWSVGLDGDQAIAGAIRAGGIRGRAFVYRREAGGWDLDAELVSPNPDQSRTFGTVAIEGDLAVVGAQNDGPTSPFTGAAYIYERNDGAWRFTQVIRSSQPTSSAVFGNDVSIEGQAIAVASALDSGSATQAGAAYVFEPNPCRADLDGDGSLTIFDFLAFQNAFDAMDPVADFDGDGDFTLFDFLAFQNAFDAGC